MLETPPDFVPDQDLPHDDQSIAHVFVRDRLVLDTRAPGWQPWAHYRAASFEAERSHVIGRLGGRVHVAVGIGDADATAARLAGMAPAAGVELPAGFAATGLRQLFGHIAEDHLAMALRGVQWVEWDRTHRLCGACGGATLRVAHERSRRCSYCGLLAYARISPAMMVLITRGRELLLGRNHAFPPGRYSALAGFVEAGETIEEAVHREVLEEVAVEVDDLHYFRSQSWPFPNSLMIAFTARWTAGEVRPQESELADARFFDIDALPELPPPLSVARALIDDTVARLRAAHTAPPPSPPARL